MPTTFNNRLRQIVLLLIIILLAILLLKEFAVFLPGFLGAVTLFILLRESYFSLVLKKHWNKTLTAILFIMSSIVVIALPIYFSIELLHQKISAILSNPVDLMMKAKIVGEKFYNLTGIQVFTDENIITFQKKAATIVPALINSSAILLSNFAVMFFLLYYLLKNGREVEHFLLRNIPLRPENVKMLSHETNGMIKANAIGIPVLAITQGIVATIGYWIFGVQDFGLWGFLTGVFSMIPVVGTAVIWLPLTAYMFSVNQTTNATGLLIYAVLLITNMDYVIRLTLLKKFMDVHPLITIFGVIIGIGLFGFWGVIFGPLLISYFVILVKIYMNEFGVPEEKPED
jgi:predicted PurR-regulated permease PerM